MHVLAEWLLEIHWPTLKVVVSPFYKSYNFLEICNLDSRLNGKGIFLILQIFSKIKANLHGVTGIKISFQIMRRLQERDLALLAMGSSSWQLNYGGME